MNPELPRTAPPSTGGPVGEILSENILNSITDRVVVLDEAGTIVAVNDGWRELAKEKGGDAASLVGRNYLAFWGDNFRRARTGGAEEAAAGIQRVLAGEVNEFTFEYPDDDTSQPRWYSISVSILKGPRRGVIVSHYNITRYRRSMDALSASELRFRALFDQAAVGVAQTDARTGRFVKVNQRFCDITGRSREELEQMTFSAITHPADAALTADSFGKLISGAVRDFTHEKRYVRKDGSEVWVHLTVSAMWAPGAKPDFSMAVAQDVTQRKQLEEQFQQAQKMEAIGTLAGGIAHDFNNILGAIGGYTELARMSLVGNPEVREYLASVLQACSRASQLVRQILAFSRQEQPERLLIQLRPVVAETVKLLRASLPSTVVFEISLATDAPVVLADATQIHQIMMNLGTNAWHAMRERAGLLQIRLERCQVDAAQAAAHPQLHVGTYARVSVRDNGCGMDADTLRRIFDPFFTTKPPGEGTGLGLAVVDGIMNGHEGALTVASEPGVGTVFDLYFPEQMSEAAAAAAAEGPVSRGHGEHILFVDDEKLLVLLGQKTLAMLGYEVVGTTLPAEALDLLRADPRRFHLVITDQTMPGMTGIALAGRVREISPGLPVLLITGYSLALRPEQVEEAGIRQILLKPTTIPLLGAAVHAALAGLPAPAPGEIPVPWRGGTTPPMAGSFSGF